jgi:dehydratase
MKSVLRVLIAACMVVVPTVALAQTAAAAPVDINFDCRADTPLGDQFANLSQTVETTAPATVAPGAAFDIVVDPAPGTVPSDVNGNTVKEIKNITLKIPVPTNSTFVSADLTGGSGLGSTPPTIEIEGDVATLTIAGPLAGGAAYELPTITAHLTAGASGTVESKLYGTSYDDPGLNLTVVVGSIIGDIDAPTACFPNPNPVLSTTTIG